MAKIFGTEVMQDFVCHDSLVKGDYLYRLLVAAESTQCKFRKYGRIHYHDNMMKTNHARRRRYAVNFPVKEVLFQIIPAGIFDETLS